jgi:hypothetical protein
VEQGSQLCQNRVHAFSTGQDQGGMPHAIGVQPSVGTRLSCFELLAHPGLDPCD